MRSFDGSHYIVTSILYTIHRKSVNFLHLDYIPYIHRHIVNNIAIQIDSSTISLSHCQIKVEQIEIWSFYYSVDSTSRPILTKRALISADNESKVVSTN